MPKFHYQAYSSQGVLAAGTVEAASESLANDILWARGLTPFEMTAASEGDAKWWQREVRLGSSSRLTDLATFTRKFATLRNADIPLDDALRIVQEQSSSEPMRGLAGSLLADVLNGSALSDALERRPTLFPVDYVSMVRAGEIGGTDGQVLMDLAELLERRLDIRSRIQSALVYPCILVVLSIATLAVLMNALIPSLAPIFMESGKPVPTDIRLLLMLQESWLEMLVAAVTGLVVAAGTWMTVGRRPSARLSLDRWKLQVPALGAFVLQQETARFARTLGTMIKAGVPLVPAVTAARAVIGNRWLSARVDRSIEALQRGVALHRALGTETPLPSVALQMIFVGEEAGKLDRMLIQVAVMFERQTHGTIERFMAALTPILTVGIAVLVGALILPIMNAVLSINELAGR